MAGRTISHGYNMPIDFYLKKNEMLCIGGETKQQTHDMMDQYYRQQLKDFREPPSKLDEDQPRYNNHSRERLSLRHNLDRSEGVMPWLPDGTFLDQIFLNDQGNSMLPDFQQLRGQIDLRARNIPMYTDEDYSVPSKEVSATDHIANKDKLFTQTQQRLQIFDTSRDYMQTPTIIGKALHGSSQLSKMIQDQTPGFLEEEAASNRNWQVELSNTMPVGWLTTPDTVFKVAKYDAPRKMADQSVDTYTNRIGGRLDSDFLVSFEGKNIPRSVVLTMMDIMRQRRRIMQYAKTAETQYGISNEDKNRQLNQLDEQLRELMRRYTEESAIPNANLFLQSERTNKNGQQFMERADPNKIYKSEVGLQLTDLIMKATRNRKHGQTQSADLRNQIEATAKEYYMLKTNANQKKINREPANDLLWQSKSQHVRPEHMTVFNYAGVHPGPRSQMAGSHDMFDVQEYKRLVHPDIQNRKYVSTNNLYTPGVVYTEPRNSMEVSMHNIGSRTTTHNGLQYISDDRQNGDMSDLTSALFTQPGRIR